MSPATVSEFVIITALFVDVAAIVVCVIMTVGMVRDEARYQRHKQMTELDRIVNGR